MSIHKYKKSYTIPSNFFNDIYLHMPRKSLINRKIPEGKANIELSKRAEDTESKLLEDIQD